MHNQPALQHHLAFVLLCRIDWPAVVKENDPVLSQLLAIHLYDRDALTDDDDEDPEGSGTIHNGPEYRQMSDEPDDLYDSRLTAMENAEVHFDRLLEMYAEREKMDVEAQDDPDYVPEQQSDGEESSGSSVSEDDDMDNNSGN